MTYLGSRKKMRWDGAYGEKPATDLSEVDKKVWEVDLLKCTHRTGELKTTSFTNEPDVIRKIQEHLDVWCTPEQPRRRRNGLIKAFGDIEVIA